MPWNNIIRCPKPTWWKETTNSFKLSSDPTKGLSNGDPCIHTHTDTKQINIYIYTYINLKKCQKTQKHRRKRSRIREENVFYSDGDLSAWLCVISAEGSQPTEYSLHLARSQPNVIHSVSSGTAPLRNAIISLTEIYTSEHKEAWDLRNDWSYTDRSHILGYQSLNREQVPKPFISVRCKRQSLCLMGP